MSDAARRFPVGLTIAAGIAFAILCGLGTWQVQRLHWKEALLARIAATQKLPAQPLAAVLARAAKGEDVDFARVSVDCLEPPFEASRVLLYSLRDGEPVWRPIAPCRIAIGRFGVIAVDRGVARGEGPNPPQLVLANPVHVEGVLRRPDMPSGMQKFVTFAENDDIGYQFRGHARLSVERAAHARSPDYVIIAASERPAPPFVTPAPLPLNIPNRHLEYVITWYGLAAALAGVYGAMVWQRMRRPGNGAA